jgi:hypothetical protein
MTTGYSQTRSVEWLLASLMVAWGVGLSVPGNTMDLPAYRLLGALAPEPVWAAWSLGIGGLRMVALYINGSWRRTPLIRTLGAMFGVIWWLVLAFCFASADISPMPAAVMWYPVLIAFEGYSVARGARDIYHSGALRWPHPS